MNQIIVCSLREGAGRSLPTMMRLKRLILQPSSTTSRASILRSRLFRRHDELPSIPMQHFAQKMSNRFLDIYQVVIYLSLFSIKLHHLGKSIFPNFSLKPSITDGEQSSNRERAGSAVRFHNHYDPLFFSFSFVQLNLVTESTLDIPAHMLTFGSLYV